MKMCVQRKAGRTLPMVPCGSLPVIRLYLAKNEAPKEEAGVSSMLPLQGFWYFAEKRTKFCGIFRGKFAEKLADFAGFSRKKVKFRRIFRGKLLEKSANLTGNFGGKLRQETIGKKQLISLDFFGQILLKSINFASIWPALFNVFLLNMFCRHVFGNISGGFRENTWILRVRDCAKYQKPCH